MSGKVMIVGTGNVGASIAYALLNQRTPVQEVVLTDLDMADAEGEMMDLSDALAVAPSFLKITTGTYADAKSCDIVVITAGANQKPGESRTDLVRQNAKIIKNIIPKIMATGFKGILLIVTNPVDTLTHLAWQCSGLPAERVIGSGTVLDSARLRLRLAERLGVHPKSIHAYQIGEHGDTELSFWSTATMGGEKITGLIPYAELGQFETAVKTSAYEIIQKKGATFYGIGACVVQIITSILGDERRILPVSNYDDNSDTFYGFPAILGRRGVLRRLDVPLTEQEGIKLQLSINAIKRTMKEAR